MDINAKSQSKKSRELQKMLQTYWEPLLQYSSFIYLGLSVSIGLLILMVYSEVKKGKKRKKEEEERLRKMAEGESVTLEELEKRYGRKG